MKSESCHEYSNLTDSEIEYVARKLDEWGSIILAAGQGAGALFAIFDTNRKEIEHLHSLVTGSRICKLYDKGKRKEVWFIDLRDRELVLKLLKLLLPHLTVQKDNAQKAINWIEYLRTRLENRERPTKPNRGDDLGQGMRSLFQ